MAKAGRKARVKDTASSCVVTFKVTEEERRALKALAHDAGLSLSDLIRSTVLGSSVTPMVTVPKVNITVYRELARTNANLNQMTRHLNEGRIRGLDRSISKSTLHGTLKTIDKRVKELRRLITGADHVG